MISFLKQHQQLSVLSSFKLDSSLGFVVGMLLLSLKPFYFSICLSKSHIISIFIQTKIASNDAKNMPSHSLFTFQPKQKLNKYQIEYKVFLCISAAVSWYFTLHCPAFRTFYLRILATVIANRIAAAQPACQNQQNQTPNHCYAPYCSFWSASRLLLASWAERKRSCLLIVDIYVIDVLLRWGGRGWAVDLGGSTKHDWNGYRMSCFCGKLQSLRIHVSIFFDYKLPQLVPFLQYVLFLFYFQQTYSQPREEEDSSSPQYLAEFQLFWLKSSKNPKF